jgi:DNA (cytosine-5)-methyltransferase 1
MKLLTFGSLFAGIGGIDLGLERAGMRCAWQVEIAPFCRKVLAKHWPDVERLGDVRECGKHNIATVDLIAGGFPCQGISRANPNGKGLNDERSGLWTEFYRIICELNPRWVLVENVRRLLSIHAGRDFGIILRDLAQCGYNATWQVLRASDFGALHRRERVFLVANRDSERIEGLWDQPILRQPAFSWCKNVRGPADLRGRPDIPEPLVCRSGDGFPAIVDAIGNAVIPQIAEWIGRRIVAVEAAHTGEIRGLI